MTVLKLGAPERPSNPALIKRLEDLLHRVRTEGGYEAAAFCLLQINPDGSTSQVVDGWYCADYPYVMLGAIEGLKLDFVKCRIEQRRED